MIYLTQLIFVKAGKEELFHEFEDFAIPLMAKYNGRIIHRLRPTEVSFIDSSGELPYEIHFISFETEEDFNRFLLDEDRKSLIHLKNEAIKSTFLVKGTAL